MGLFAVELQPSATLFENGDVKVSRATEKAHVKGSFHEHKVNRVSYVEKRPCQLGQRLYGRSVAARRARASCGRGGGAQTDGGNGLSHNVTVLTLEPAVSVAPTSDAPTAQ
jgi:hypothetical protein